jgi:hypothetical protein
MPAVDDIGRWDHTRSLMRIATLQPALMAAESRR